jgi:cbb3-type cytochrome oxidase cytochrome c subunit
MKYKPGNTVTGMVGQDRLDHYNAWLMDTEREFGVPYAGFPGDLVETVQDAPVFSVKNTNKINKLARRKVTVDDGPKVAYNRDMLNKKGNEMTKVTNLSKATDLVKSAIDSRTPKAEILNLLVSELSVSRSNAFVYFTKATKALNVSIEVDKGAVKAPKAVKVNKVTETSPEKARAKVAEIDAVIANLRKSGAAVSPFAALGA